MEQQQQQHTKITNYFHLYFSTSLSPSPFVVYNKNVYIYALYSFLHDYIYIKKFFDFTIILIFKRKQFRCYDISNLASLLLLFLRLLLLLFFSFFCVSCTKQKLKIFEQKISI